MGQYQQWLSAQEIDRLLKAEIENLETELFHLQDRATILEQVVPATENVILQILTGYLQDHPVQESQPAQAEQNQEDQQAPVPLLWDGLTRMETPSQPGAENIPYLPDALTQREMSADMLAFFDKRSQTDPRLSALLQRERQRTEAAGGSAYAVDDETRRLNENIQRWFARWHRQITDDVPSEEVEHGQ